MVIISLSNMEKKSRKSIPYLPYLEQLAPHEGGIGYIKLRWCG